MNVRTYKTTGLTLAALAILSLGFAGNTYAAGGHEADQNSGHNRKGNVAASSSASAEAAQTVQISDEQRTLISKFIMTEYRDDCAGEKKADDCSPEAQAAQYSVGAVLGPDVNKKAVPAKLRSQLTAVSGHEYVQIGRDIALISNDGKIVVDSVTLASAIGQ